MGENPIDELPPRILMVDAVGNIVPMFEHEVMAALGIPPAVSAGFDILADYLGCAPPETWIDLLWAAHHEGYDAEAFARKIIVLSKAGKSTVN